MKKIVKVKGLCSRELQAQVLAAEGDERRALLERIVEERHWMIARMHAKGYELEASVFGIYGIFTRGPARGTLRREEEVGAA